MTRTSGPAPSSSEIKASPLAARTGLAGSAFPPAKRMEENARPPKTIPRVRDHHTDWIEAIRNDRERDSNSSIGSSLTEIVKLGMIAIKLTGTKLEGDAPQRQFTKSAEANALVDPPVCAGGML